MTTFRCKRNFKKRARIHLNLEILYYIVRKVTNLRRPQISGYELALAVGFRKFA